MENLEQSEFKALNRHHKDFFFI